MESPLVEHWICVCTKWSLHVQKNKPHEQCTLQLMSTSVGDWQRTQLAWARLTLVSLHWNVTDIPLLNLSTPSVGSLFHLFGPKPLCFPAIPVFQETTINLVCAKQQPQNKITTNKQTTSSQRRAELNIWLFSTNIWLFSAKYLTLFKYQTSRT